MVSLDVNKVREQLKSLKNLPNLKEVRALKKRLQSELKILEKKEIPEIEVTVFPKVSKSDKISKAQKKYHNYIRQIRNNFPDIPYLTIRRELAKRRKGQQSKIPDVVWQNPSP